MPLDGDWENMNVDSTGNMSDITKQKSDIITLFTEKQLIFNDAANTVALLLYALAKYITFVWFSQWVFSILIQTRRSSNTISLSFPGTMASPPAPPRYKILSSLSSVTFHLHLLYDNSGDRVQHGHDRLIQDGKTYTGAWSSSYRQVKSSKLLQHILSWGKGKEVGGFCNAV